MADENDNKTYEIKRFYQRGGHDIVRRYLSLEDAQEHCSDPETNSETCRRPENVRRTDERGPWFDGYEEE